MTYRLHFTFEGAQWSRLYRNVRDLSQAVAYCMADHPGCNVHINKAALVRPCPEVARDGNPVCNDRDQCWEQCPDQNA